MKKQLFSSLAIAAALTLSMPVMANMQENMSATPQTTSQEMPTTNHTKLSNKADMLNAKHQQRMDKRKTKFQEKMAAHESKHQEKMNQRKAKFEAKMKRHESKHQEKMAKHKAKVEKQQ